MGETAAVNAMGGNEKVDLRYVANCLYTLPEAATVGLTEEAAKKEYDISIGTFSLYANGRALASGETDGFVKVIIDKKYGEILGVQMVGPVAAEMICEAALCMSMEITAHEVAATVHPPPHLLRSLYGSVCRCVGEMHSSAQKIKRLKGQTKEL
jgi:dihydrolipoamide dehydrogenase (EC 1.8.1.4)